MANCEYKEIATKEDTDLLSRFAVAIEAIQKQGVIAVGKHFIGKVAQSIKNQVIDGMI